MNGVLREYPRGRDVAEVMAAALAAVEPASAVRRALQREGRAVYVNGQLFELSVGGRVLVAGAGKACAPMVEATVEILGDAIGAGVVIVKEGHLTASGRSIGPVELFEAGHPEPDARGLEATARLATLLEGAREDDLVLALISGGGSALLTLPAGWLKLDDIRAATSLLLRSGATIGEVNTLRKHCTRLSGGGLARLAQPARVISLIVSDVVGSPLDVIASGPTSPDLTTFEDAWGVIRRYGLRAQLPVGLVEHLRWGRAGGKSETPKPDDPVWSRVCNHIIADNRTAAESAVATARARGFRAELLTSCLEGEAREVGRVAAALARELSARAAVEGPLLLVLGGETTVTVRGEGRGGRNQELALGAVGPLAGVRGVLIAALATDGGDGPTDAAGAIATGETLARAAALGSEADDFLRRNDAYNFFAPLDALLKPGPTLTNVNDLLFIVAAGS